MLLLPGPGKPISMLRVNDMFTNSRIIRSQRFKLRPVECGKPIEIAIAWVRVGFSKFRSLHVSRVMCRHNDTNQYERQCQHFPGIQRFAKKPDPGCEYCA